MTDMTGSDWPASLKNRTVLVLGLGDTGFSAVRWLREQGASVRVADTRPDPPQGERMIRIYPEVEFHFGPFVRPVFDGVDLVVASPGVPLAEPEVAAALARGQRVVGDVELFARTVQSWKIPPRVVAITGANGKSTVTTMVGRMVESAGLSVATIGNIGTPVLDVLSPDDRKEVYVLELSSFQLETTHHLDLVAGTVLNITEDHLDRYPDMAAYTAAKARIFMHCRHRILNREDSRSLAMGVPGSITFGLDEPAGPLDWGLVAQPDGLWIQQGSDPVMPLRDLSLPGRHNAANAMAALALCDALEVPREGALKGLREFRGLPHRVEPVATVHGVTYFDDSKGTNVGATVAALKGMTQPVVLIAGGEGKGQDFAPLGEAVRDHARGVVLIGRDARILEQALQGSGVPVGMATSLEEAVHIASRMAQPGDGVLMSPACASFDMFRNYLHRAEVFVAEVHALAREAGIQGGA